jgi:hypothetical protein
VISIASGKAGQIINARRPDFSFAPLREPFFWRDHNSNLQYTGHAALKIAKFKMSDCGRSPRRGLISCPVLDAVKSQA